MSTTPLTGMDYDARAIWRRAVAQALRDPQWFYTHVLKFPALPWQVRATHAVLDVRRKQGLRVVNKKGLPRISIRSCHGPGKTQFLAMLMHLWNFTTYGKIACTAPKEAQLTKRLLPRFRACMKDAPEMYRKNIMVQGKEIKIAGDPDWGAVMETASDPDNLAGYHDKPQLFLVDEASAKRLDPMFPVIEGAITTPGSCSVEIGNPTRVEGEFYNHHNKQGTKDLYYRMHIKAEDAPQLISQQWLEDMRVKYGENSPIYLIRCLGEFASYDDYILVPPEYIEDALDTEEEPDGSACRLRVSVDVADGGQDSTVVTVCRHYDSFVQVLCQRRFWFPTGKAPIEAALTADRMFRAFRGSTSAGDDFVVDGLGVGAGTVGKLLEMGHNVINYKGGSASNDATKYRNLRVQCYMALYAAFRDGAIRFSPDVFESDEDAEEFRAHLLSIKRRETNDKVDDLMPKDSIARDGLPSPDCADSLMMQFVDRSFDVVSVGTAPILIGGMYASSVY